MNEQIRRTTLALFLVCATACSGGGGTSGGSAPASPPPPPVNNPPTLSVASTYDVEEGRLFAGEYSASDPDGVAVSVILTGADKSFFKLEDGFIVANGSFDFDVPQDADGDSIYQVSLEVSDGDLSVVQDLTVSVLDIPRDGIVRIMNVHDLTGAGDFDGDGLDELLVRPVRASGEPMMVAGILLPGQPSVVESPAVFDATAPVGTAGTIEGRVTFRMDYDVGSPFNTPLVDGTFVSATGIAKFSGMVAAGLVTGSLSPADTTVLFPDMFDMRHSGSDINLSTDVLPAGLRSTRDQAARFLGAFIPVGDLNGDGYSEALQDRHGRFVSSYGNAELFMLVSGKSMRDGSSDDLFAEITDITTQAVTVTYGNDRYNAGSRNDHWPMRDPGTADVDGDGFDDFVYVVGLRGSAPYVPGTDTPVEGHEIGIYSGRRLMDRPGGIYKAESFASLDVSKIIMSDDIGTPVVTGIGDVDGDGHADILIRMLNGGLSDTESVVEAYLVSGQALVSAEDGTIQIGREAVPGVTGLNTHSGTGPPDDAFLTGNMIGGTGSDIVLSSRHYSTANKTVTATAVVLSESLFRDGFPELIDIEDGPRNPPDLALAALPAGSFVRIDSPPYKQVVTLEDSGLVYRGLGIFSSKNSDTNSGSASIGDLDGDGKPELVLVYITDEQTGAVGSWASSVFRINSRVLESARQAGEMIDLGSDFE